MPPEASSNLPMRSLTAPVKAPRSWPNSADSSRVGGSVVQSSTTNGGNAGNAVDGRTDGVFGSGTQTHTAENSDRPWWEVDLGGDQAVDSVVVWNRTEGDLGRRLDGFTLVVLDRDRQEVFRKENNPAPAQSVRIPVGGDPVATLQRAAIRALVSMNGSPAETFGLLSDVIARGGPVVVAAGRGLRTIPVSAWPTAAASKAAKGMVAWAAKVPAAERTSADYVETIQLASDLGGVLPEAERGWLRGELKGLRVAAFVVRTVREQMRFDTTRLRYEVLLRAYWRNIDPFDGAGQFCDHGDSYRAVIFSDGPAQANEARRSLQAAARELGRPAAEFKVTIRPLQRFWPAEEYHQNYADRNPVRYAYYRWACGRDRRLDAVWGERARQSVAWRQPRRGEKPNAKASAKERSGDPS